MDVYTFRVEFADDLDALKNKLPRRVKYVRVIAATDNEAHLIAAQMGCTQGVTTDVQMIA